MRGICFIIRPLVGTSYGQSTGRDGARCLQKPATHRALRAPISNEPSVCRETSERRGMREPFCDHGGERGTGRSGPREEAARDSRHRRPGARHSARQPRPPCGSHGACWPRRPVAGACPKATAQGRQLGLGQREGGLGDRPPWPRCGRRQDEARVDAAEPRPSGAARAGRVSRFQRHSLRPQQPLCLLITWLAPHSAGLASFRAQDTPSAGRRAEAGPVGTPGSLGLGGAT